MARLTMRHSRSQERCGSRRLKRETPAGEDRRSQGLNWLADTADLARDQENRKRLNHECPHPHISLDRYPRPRMVASAINPRPHGLAESWPRHCSRVLAASPHVIARLGVVMICEICGSDPCELPSFCEAAREHSEREKARPKKTYAPAEKPKTWRDGMITAKDLQTKTF